MTRLLAFPLLAAMMALLVACSDDDNGDGSTTSTQTRAEPVTRTDGTSTAEGPDGLQFVLDSVGGDIDVDEMRPHLASELQAMTDEELRQAIFCFPSDVSAEVVDQKVEDSGNTATLTVSWRVTDDAASAVDTTVERTWTFEAVSQGESPDYAITGLPTECPFQSSDPGGTQEPAIETPEDDD